MAVSRSGVGARVELAFQIGNRRQLMLDQRPGQEFVHGQAFLADHRIFGDGFAEDVPGVGQQAGGLVGVAERGGGADAEQVAGGGLEPGLEPADQQGEVGALGAVEGVEFVDHQVAQGARAVVLPQHPVPWADQQVVEHLVVGEQDVGRIAAHRVLGGDDARGAHGVRAGGAALALADVETDPNPVAQAGAGVDGFGEAAGLVAAEGVHRVDHQRLDAAPASGLVLAPAVVEQRVEEAFGLAGAGAGGDQGRGGGSGAVQPPPGEFLMVVGRMPGFKTGKAVPVAGAGPKRQAEREIGAFVEAAGLVEEGADDAPEGGVGRLEAGDQVLAQTFDDVLGDEAGDHGALVTLIRMRPRTILRRK